MHMKRWALILTVLLVIIGGGNGLRQERRGAMAGVETQVLLADGHNSVN